MIKDFKLASTDGGTLSLNLVKFTNNKGFASAKSTGSSSFIVENGFKKFLLAFHNVQIESLSMTDCSFSNNGGIYIDGENHM